MRGRRHFLKGLATSLLIPPMESLGSSLSTQGANNISRLAFIYIPNGVNVDHWYNDSTTTLPSSLAPLASLKDNVSIIRNLQHAKANANGDGAGDHARANSAYLTGCQPKKTAGSDINIGTSIDQIIARSIGYKTPLPSLELSTTTPRRSGRCDSGYSCAYQYNLSWVDENTPAPAENNPRFVFEKLFGSGNKDADQKRRMKKKSILDFISEDARKMNKRLGQEDREKMEEYLNSVREIETRIEAAETFKIQRPEREIPIGIPESYREHIAIQFEMMRLAFKSDATRISTFMLGAEGSNRSFPEIGVHGKHHNLSHHRGNAGNLAALAKIDRFYIEQLSRFLTEMKNTTDCHGQNLLDSSTIVYGGGIKDGNRHSHNDLPVILAGNGNGTLSPGTTKWAAKNTPMTNLYLSIAEKMGVSLDRIGDSTGKLKGI